MGGRPVTNMAEKQMYTPEETISLLNGRAKESGGDNFRIKVFRRRGMSGLLEHIATMTDAQVVHVANPEMWIPRLCGGGNYVLSVFPSDNPTTALGGHIPYSYQGEARDVVPRSVREPGWQGPAGIVFPEEREQVGPSVVSVSPGVPGSVPSHVSAANVRAGLDAPGAPLSSYSSGPDTWSLVQRERELADRERKLLEEIGRREAAVREERLRAENDAKLREVETRLMRSQPAQSGGGINEILTALAPVIGQMIQGQNEMRMQMMKLQADSQAQMQMFMKEVVTARQGLDPTTATLIEVLKTQANKPAGQEILTQALDAMGGVTRTYAEMLNTVADLNLGGAPQEHPVLAALKEITTGFKALSKGTRQAARSALPAPAPEPMYPPMPPTFAEQAIARPPVAPPPPPYMQPGPVQAPQGQGFAGYPPPATQVGPPQGAPPQVAEMPALLRLESAIRQRMHPTQVATFFVQSVEDPSIQAALAAVGGNIEALIEQRLGEWAMSDPANMTYLQALGAEVMRIGTAAGMIEPDAEDDVDEDEAGEGEDEDVREAADE